MRAIFPSVQYARPRDGCDEPPIVLSEFATLESNVHNKCPVAASSAITLPENVHAYNTRPTTSGFVCRLPFSPVSNSHATFSCATLLRLICFSGE